MREKAERFVEIVDSLRKKCPWDRKQTHESLVRYLQEEAFEVIEAIYSGDRQRLKEELGDLLFQIVFHARIAEEQGTFDLGGVIASISGKMVSRHPHVFGNGRHPADNEEALRDFWNEKKAQEKKHRAPVSLESIARQEGPTLFQRALYMQNSAARRGFDWSRPEEILDKLEEEIRELRESLQNGGRKEIREEIGDMILVLTNLCRFLHVDYESAFIQALVKFGNRFDRLAAELARRGMVMEQCPIEKLEGIWQEIKKCKIQNEKCKKKTGKPGKKGKI
jgi:MazG family protein